MASPVLPQHAAFRSNNDKYLTVEVIDGKAYLKFSSPVLDPENKAMTFTITNITTSRVCIMSDQNQKFWRLDDANDIVVDSDKSPDDQKTNFLPTFIGGDRLYTLTNLGNNMKCKRFTHDHRIDCLSAPVNNGELNVTITVIDLDKIKGKTDG